LVCGVLSAAAGAVGWGVDLAALRSNVNSTHAIPPLNATLADGPRELPEPVSVEQPSQPDEEAPATSFNALAATALSQPSVAETAAPREIKRPGRLTPTHDKHVVPVESPSMDMEARYALTYQPERDASAFEQVPGSDTPSPAPAIDPSLLSSDL
jgi:hypothetical protein